MRNAACNTINKRLILVRLFGIKNSHFLIGQRLKLILSRPPAVQRTFIPKHLMLHKAHGRTAKNKKQIAVCPCMVDNMLQAGRNRFIRSCEIRILINHKYQSLVFSHTCNFRKSSFKARIYRGSFRIRMFLFINCF